MEFTQKDYDYQTKLIGDFFVRFDQAISVMPFLIPQIIYKKRCSAIERRNIDTLLSEMTASSLRNKFDSLLADNYSDFPELIRANTELSSAASKIAEIRNSFAHGSYRIGWKNFEGKQDKNHFFLQHSKATKKGFDKRAKIYHIDQIKRLNQQLWTLYNAYIKFGAIFLLQNKNQSILDHIEFIKSDIKDIGKIQFSSIKERK